MASGTTWHDILQRASTTHFLDVTRSSGVDRIAVLIDCDPATAADERSGVTGYPNHVFLNRPGGLFQVEVELSRSARLGLSVKDRGLD